MVCGRYMWRSLAVILDRFHGYLGCRAKVQKYPILCVQQYVLEKRLTAATRTGFQRSLSCWIEYFIYISS